MGHSSAEDMIDGTCCALCGAYFHKGGVLGAIFGGIYTHGYPVACDYCWHEDCGYELAIKDTY